MSQLGQFDNGSALMDVETLTGDTGGAVGPNGAGNINILGGDGITTAGNPGTNTITISQTGDAYTIVTVQTVDATPTAIFTFALGEDEAITISATMAGAISDYSAAIVGTVSGGARRQAAGVTTLIGSPVSNFSEDAPGNPDFTIAVSGNNVIIQVTGVAATTYNWRGLVQYVHQTV